MTLFGCEHSLVVAVQQVIGRRQCYLVPQSLVQRRLDLADGEYTTTIEKALEITLLLQTHILALLHFVHE